MHNNLPHWTKTEKKMNWQAIFIQLRVQLTVQVVLTTFRQAEKMCSQFMQNKSLTFWRRMYVFHEQNGSFYNDITFSFHIQRGYRSIKQHRCRRRIQQPS